MVIVYESKTGFTKRYADMLAAKTGLSVFSTNELSKVKLEEEIIFLGWMKIGKIQGLTKVRKYNVKAVCGSGTGRTASPLQKKLLQEISWKAFNFFICVVDVSL